MTINPTSSDWLDVYDVTGITPGTPLIIQYQSPFSLAEFLVAGSPPAPEDEGLRSDPFRAQGSVMQFNPNYGEFLYVRSVFGNPQLSVIENSSLTVGVGGIHPMLIVKRPGPDARLKTETLAANQQYIVDGFGFYLQLIASSVAAGSKAFFEITVPTGLYLALNHREVITDKERVFYRLYTSGAYSGFTPVTGYDAYNLRSDAATSTVADIAFSGTFVTPPTQSDAVVVIPVFGAEGVGGRATGNLSSDLTFRAWAPDTSAVIEIHNESVEKCR